MLVGMRRPQAWARVIQEGTCSVVSYWDLQMSQQTQLCLLPGVKDLDVTPRNSAVHPVPLGHRLGCSGETVDLTCQGCDNRPLMVSSIVQFTNKPSPLLGRSGPQPRVARGAGG